MKSQSFKPLYPVAWFDTHPRILNYVRSLCQGGRNLSRNAISYRVHWRLGTVHVTSSGHAFCRNSVFCREPVAGHGASLLIVPDSWFTCIQQSDHRLAHCFTDIHVRFGVSVVVAAGTSAL